MILIWNYTDRYAIGCIYILIYEDTFVKCSYPSTQFLWTFSQETVYTEIYVHVYYSKTMEAI